MGAPQEIVDEIFTVIEGGRELGDSAKIIQFPSDNGQKVYEAVEVTMKGSNGTGITYLAAAFSAIVGGVAKAVSAGAVFLATPLTTFAASVGPALGVLVGYSWYQLAPEFWNELAEDLMNAGETVNGKVVGFLNDQGIMTYSPTAIDIFKSKLLEYGVFDTVDMPEYADEGDYEVTGYMTPNELFKVVMNRTKYPFYFSPEANATLQTILLQNNDRMAFITDLNLNFKAQYPNIQTWMIPVIFCDPRERISLGTYVIGSADFITLYAVKHPLIPDANLVVNVEFHTGLSGQKYFLGENSRSPGFLDISGINATYNKKELQDYAKYPDEHSVIETYPNWPKVEFPEIDPGTGGDPKTIGTRLPIEFPDLLPKIIEVQWPVQNPDPAEEDLPETIVRTIEDPDFDPITGYPEPLPEPDPDPQPGTGEDIDNPTETDTPHDPIDPDPPTPITPVIPVTPLPDTVHSNKLFTVYNPNSSQLGQLGGYLWDSDLIDILRKIWQNPLDGIISLIQVYATPSTGSNSNIILGYLDSGISAPVVNNQFAVIDCGTVTIPEISENCLDYIPYTKLELYLPFIGVTEIDTNEFMGGSINVKYKVDVYTGSCIAEVKCTRARDLANGTVLYTFNGNCSQQIPLTSGDARGVLSALMGAAAVGLSIASGGASAITGAGLLRSGARVAGEVGSVASHEMLHVSHSGNLSANAGIMCQKKPYVIINRQRAYTANGYNKYYGYPANKTINPGNHSGFLRLKAGRLQSAATEAEKTEIYELLSHGVIM